MIERLEPDPDILAVHRVFFCPVMAGLDPAIHVFLILEVADAGHRRYAGHDDTIAYSTMLATTPAPTVWPPSRMAKRSFSPWRSARSA